MPSQHRSPPTADNSPATHESPLQTLLTLPLNSYSPLTPHARSMVSSVQAQNGDARSGTAVVDTGQGDESPTPNVEEGPLSATLRQIGLRKSVNKWRLAADTAMDDEKEIAMNHEKQSSQASKFAANRKSIASPGVFAAFQQQQRDDQEEQPSPPVKQTKPLVVKHLDRLNSRNLTPPFQHQHTEVLTSMPSPTVVRPTTSRGLPSARTGDAHSFSRLSRSHSLQNRDPTSPLQHRSSPTHRRSKSIPIPSPSHRRPDGWGGLMPPSGWFADAEMHRGPLVSTPIATSASMSDPQPQSKKKSSKKVVRFASLVPSLRDVLGVVQEEGEGNEHKKTASPMGHHSHPVVSRPPPYSASALFNTPLVDIEKSLPPKDGKARDLNPPPRTRIRTVKAKWLYFCAALVIVSMVLAIAFAVAWSNAKSGANAHTSAMQSNADGEGDAKATTTTTTTKSAADATMTQLSSVSAAPTTTATTTTMAASSTPVQIISGHPKAVSSAINQSGNQR